MINNFFKIIFYLWTHYKLTEKIERKNREKLQIAFNYVVFTISTEIILILIIKILKFQFEEIKYNKFEIYINLLNDEN